MSSLLQILLFKPWRLASKGGMKEPPLSGLVEEKRRQHNANPLKLSHNFSQSEDLMCLEWIVFFN
jgi:hypothetical protein